MNAESPDSPMEDDREPDELLIPVEATPTVDKGIRLQRFLAMAGCGPRRKCEEFIQDGRVTVGGKTVTELGFRVERTHHVKLDGERVRLGRRVYYILNKPMGYLCTNRDPIGRPRAVDLIPKQKELLFTVGRLDENSQGLLLVTNDGEMAHRLAHPRFSVRKVYRVQVQGVPDREILKKLKEGMYFAEGVFRVADVELKKAAGTASILDIVLTEGQNREIRRLMAKLGHKVQRLNRIALGPLKLGDLPIGAYRPLSNYELGELHDLIEEVGSGKRKSARKRGTRGTVEVSAARKAADDRKEAREAATRRVRGAGGTRGKARTALNRATRARAATAAKAAGRPSPAKKPTDRPDVAERPVRRGQGAGTVARQPRPDLETDDDFSGEKTPSVHPAMRKGASTRSSGGSSSAASAAARQRKPAREGSARPGRPTSRKPNGQARAVRRPPRRDLATGTVAPKTRTDDDFEGEQASGRKPGAHPAARTARRPAAKAAGKSGKGKPRRPRA